MFSLHALGKAVSSGVCIGMAVLLWKTAGLMEG
jgi:hypothetical protein